MKRISAIAFVVLLLALTGCGAPKGGILIKENIHGTACQIEFTQWSQENKCELSLNKNDALQVEIACESGNADLDIRGKNGAKAYTGNGLDTGSFTVKIPEADDYVITIEGENASGYIYLKNLSR